MNDENILEKHKILGTPAFLLYKTGKIAAPQIPPKKINNTYIIIEIIII